MFYQFLYPLRDLFFGFNIFRYITFRTIAALITAFILSIILGPLIIKLLRHFNIGQHVRDESQAPGIYPLHKHKEGTPTMGGLIMLIAIVASTVLWARLDNYYVLLTLFSTVWLGGVGFIDDYIKLKEQDSSGLTTKTKLLGQVIIGLIVGFILFFDKNIDSTVHFPFFKNAVYNIGIFYILFVTLVIVAASNSVNLTDGLDGLAVGCIIMVAFSYTAVSYIVGNFNFSNYLFLKFIPGAGELAVYCAAIVGAGLGFLWFNSYPASVFMGDIGSLALGGGIGVVSCCIKKEMLLLIAGGIFVLEAISVILQVASFKLRRQRIFLMAPFHHHLQMKGWNESKIVVRFWIIGIILALFTLGTLKLR
ncbi:MAG: phospho-N-acetylmuramoyl-pentapeptide-transferase [Candidatus Omnitrophota bacterium]